MLAHLLAPGRPVFESLIGPRVLLAIGTFGKLFFLAVAAAVAVLIVARFENGTPSRSAWRLLSSGLIAMSLAQSFFVYYQFVRNVEVPYPSPADIFFLAAYPLLIGALGMFLRAYLESGFPVGPAAGRLRLAAGTAVLCLAIGYPILMPLVRQPGERFETLLNVLYPLLDFLLLIPTVLLIRISLRFRGGAVWKVWVRLLSGFVFLFAADTLFAYYAQFGRLDLTDLVDATYLLAYGFLCLGVLYQRDLQA